MEKFDLNPPSGTRDFLPNDIKYRNKAFATIKHAFEQRGFQQMDTPAFERLEILSGKYGDENDKLIFKILKRGEQLTGNETDLALRYDLTVPLARIIAKYQNQLPSVFKRYQIGPVWRADKPGKGRFREFYQCDIDIVGNTTILADVEIIFVISKTLENLGLKEFIIQVNSRKILTGLIEVFNISEPLRNKFLTALDKLDKIGAHGVEKELDKIGLPMGTINFVLENLIKNNSLEFESISQRLSNFPDGVAGINEVKDIITLVSPLVGKNKIIFAPFLARGLNYYTGSIFEIKTKESSYSIASGGRYDNLVGLFSKRTTPVVGGSLGVERVLLELEKTHKKNEKKSLLSVFIAVWDKDFRSDALEIFSKITEGGIIAEIYLGEGNISRQIRFASENGINYFVLYGPDEQKRKEVKLKNLETGTQESVMLENIVNYLKEKLGGRNE